MRVNCIAPKHNITFITCHSHYTNQDLSIQNLSLVQLCYYSSNTFKEITVKYLINAHFVWCRVSKQQIDCGGRSREGPSPFLISNLRPKGQGAQIICFLKLFSRPPPLPLAQGLDLPLEGTFLYIAVQSRSFS